MPTATNSSPPNTLGRNRKPRKDNQVNSQMNSEVESICDKLKVLVAVFEQTKSVEEIKDSQYYLGLIAVVNNNLQQIIENKIL